ncbi:hypothetical protein L873DRAFT_1844040 [Choiromyces venosus 120613-1]|uniref:WD40 repeat-like protein n=1 Tax=Choiromyces venosus 120613-1 TaxID=1336337 RepID=A0A3N4JN49_9PEZI|nr:hypothetical protein L873DRAFT_1844040 [Choiromyces venosus 120613-1]
MIVNGATATLLSPHVITNEQTNTSPNNLPVTSGEMSPPRPRVSSPSPSFKQITYQLSHAHTNTSKFYPRPLASRPTSLSEILVIGHESGIKILWRARPNSEEDGDETMALDDHQQQIDEAQDEPEEGAFACEYTIHLGTSVNSISFPPASILPTEGPTDDIDDRDNELDLIADKLLYENMLIVAACGDRTIRLITLPLAPPSSSHKKREHIVILGGGVSGHREPAECVSLSVLPTPSDEFNFAHPDSDDVSYDSRLSDKPSGWDVVIASSSVDTSGVLLLWRISILPPTRSSLAPVSFKPTSRPTTLFLQSPITSLAFSTSAHSLLRKHHLLVSDRKGAVRILDTKTKTWLCSFYTPYSQVTERRKKVLGAEWCTGGRSVVTLCEDGEWGIWDLEGVLAGEQEAGSVVTGFIVGGMVGETWYNNSSKKSSHGNHDENASEISGRSPSLRASSVISAGTSITSRRRRSGSLKPEDRIGLKGLLSVAPIGATSFFSNQATLVKGKSTTTMGSLQIYDEIVTMVFGSVILVLPSLKKFWKAEEIKIKKRAAQNVATGSGNFNSIAWSGEDGKVEKEFLVLEGWDTRGAAVGDLSVVPEDAEHSKTARVLLTTSCRLVLLDVGESGNGKADEQLNASVKPVETGARLAERMNPTRRGVVGGKGKRKVGFMQDSSA